MTDSDFQHGCDWDRVKDLTGWELTEKLDGVRLFWDGATAWTRGGNAMELPARIRAGLGGLTVDGELWAGRGGFRLASIAARLGKFHESVVFVNFADLPKIICRSNAHALELMAAIQRDGGEGVMARQPGLVWRPGRTVGLLKIK